LFSLVIHGQTPKGFLIKEYSSENGLPSNGIKGMEFDETTGFLWIGTEAGIARFNGIDFKIFSKNNLPYLSTERIAYLLRNDKGAIFTADLNDHLFRINANSIIPYDSSASNPDPNNNRVFSQSLSSPALSKRIRYTAKGLPVSGIIKVIPIDETMCLVLDAYKCIYKIVASKPNAIKIPDQDFELKEIFKIGTTVFSQTSKGALLINPYNGSFNKIPVLNEDSQDFSDSLSNAMIYWKNGIDQPIIFNGKNAWLLRYENNRIIAQLICDEVPVNSLIVFAQYSSKLKILFLGTDSKGLIIIRPKQVLPMKSASFSSIEKNATYAQVELDNGNILTNNGSIIGTNKTDKTNLPINTRFNLTVFQLGDSLLYYAKNSLPDDFNCLHSYHLKKGVTTVFNKIRITENFAICKAGQRIVVATNFGIGILTEDSLNYVYRNKDSASVVYAMEEIGADKVMLAYCDQLVTFDLKKNISDTILNTPGYCVRSINKIRDYFFIGTYGNGYFMMHNGKIRKMPLDKNNFLLYTHCIVPDESGFCWMSTNRGLFKASVDDLIEAYQTGRTTVYYHYFGRNDGMDITEMNGGCSPCALWMKDRKISFPTMDGLLWVKPAEIKETLPYGDIYIDAIQSGNTIIENGSKQLSELPSQTSNLTVSLGYPSWCNDENIYLSYRIKKEGPWIPIPEGKQSRIEINNLHEGQYHLQIRKINGYGPNNVKVIEIPFTIIAPWYKKWWSLPLALLLLTGMTFFFLKIRTRQYQIKQAKLQVQIEDKTKTLQLKNNELEKNNKINMRLISIISHDIVTPLKFLAIGGENLVAKRNLMSDELQQETLQEITNTARELQQLSINIMNWIKYQNENKRLEKENFHLHELVNQVKAILDPISLSKDIQIINEVNPGLQLYQYREPLKILIYNLTTNAINFSSSGSVLISGNATANNVVITVADKGIGMTDAQIANILSDEYIISSANIDNRKGNGLGYLIIKDLLKMMGASMQIESKKQEGSKVIICIPV
jgi:signal transduction histidine kinase/ligand-binding sensor domain-containing protein